VPHPIGIDTEPTHQRGAGIQAGHLGIPGDPQGRIGDAVTRLRALTLLGSRSGRIYVVDTNALPHYTRFDRLPWTERLPGFPVRSSSPLSWSTSWMPKSTYTTESHDGDVRLGAKRGAVNGRHRATRSLAGRSRYALELLPSDMRLRRPIIEASFA
jgi:hypothetical protein